MTQSEFNAMLENALDFYNSRHSGNQIDQGVTGGLGAVRFDAAQTLAEMQKAQARSNLGIRADGATGAVDSVNGKTGTVVLNGDDIYANSQNTETIGEALGNIHYVNPNLLDNWYFGDPVNQRGEASYEAVNDKYSIDRWLVRRGVLTVEDGGINIKYNGTGTSDTVALSQKLPAEIVNAIIGVPVTLSVLVDGELYTHTWESPYAGENRRNFTPTFTVLLNFDPGWGAARPLQIFSASTTGINIKAVKLELGSVQTLARQVNGEWVLNEIPNYAEQLARCQRYFVKYKSIIAGGFLTSSALNYHMSLRTPVPMRAIPTVKMESYIARKYNGYTVYTGANPTAPTALSVAQSYTTLEAGAVDIFDRIATAVDENNIMLSYVINELELSADL